jgi:cytochrome c oxidase subunit 2
MKEITGNKNFVYEIACDQMCGSGHYSMRGVIIVETQGEYDAWMASKKPQYLTVKEGAAPSSPAAADSTMSVGTAASSKPLAKLK